tara:strand:- start:826 stop:1068 length:243 start_codon:yes stop_codon:yes gene_type:complete
MTSYLVCWEIDIDEDTPSDAAKEALSIMQNKESEALFFKVIHSASGKMIDVNLGRQNDDRTPATEYLHRYPYSLIWRTNR